MKTRFKNAVSKLIHAFFNDKLKAGNCTACAVGNICNNTMYWSDIFMTSPPGKQETILNSELVRNNFNSFQPHIKEIVLNNIRETGYNWQELARVEEAFEINTKYKTGNIINCVETAKLTTSQIKEDQYKGLCAVIEVLCDIEGYDKPEMFKSLFKFDEEFKQINFFEEVEKELI